MTVPPSSFPEHGGAKTLTDLVQIVFVELYEESPEFRKLLSATTQEESEEGSLAADDLSASIMIRDRAKTSPDQEIMRLVGGARIIEVVEALRRVMRRHGVGRPQRRYKDQDQGPEGSPR